VGVAVGAGVLVGRATGVAVTVGEGATVGADGVRETGAEGPEQASKAIGRIKSRAINRIFINYPCYRAKNLKTVV
jgi:hypothetical protein